MVLWESIFSAFRLTSIRELVCGLLLLLILSLLPFLLGILCGCAILRFEQRQESADTSALDQEQERRHNAYVRDLLRQIEALE